MAVFLLGLSLSAKIYEVVLYGLSCNSDGALFKPKEVGLLKK